MTLKGKTTTYVRYLAQNGEQAAVIGRVEPYQGTNWENEAVVIRP